MAKFVSFDDYIAQSEEFAKPILAHIRKMVHEACPQVEETFKWSFPNFLYKGKILCHMAAFKQHTAFGFWLAAQMSDPEKLFGQAEEGAMGQFGKIRSLDDLPERAVFLAYIQEAMLLTDQGKTLQTTRSKQAKVLDAPVYLTEALQAVPAAMDCFEKFSQSHKNEYIEWITEAKTEATRLRRIAQMIDLLLEGKNLNWKYQRP